LYLGIGHYYSKEYFTNPKYCGSTIFDDDAYLYVSIHNKYMVSKIQVIK